LGALAGLAAQKKGETVFILEFEETVEDQDLRGQTEVDGFYWTVLAPDIVNSGREEQGSVSV